MHAVDHFRSIQDGFDAQPLSRKKGDFSLITSLFQKYSLCNAVLDYLSMADHSRIARTCHSLNSFHCESGTITLASLQILSVREIAVINNRYKRIKFILSCKVNKNENEIDSLESILAGLTLEGWENFHKLEIPEPVLSSTDCQMLTAFTNLRELDLSRVNIAELSFLQDLRSVNVLDLSWTKIADRELIYLSHLPLTTLSLAGTEVSDRGVIHFSFFPNGESLEVLDLSHTKIRRMTWAALNYFSQLKTLYLGSLSLASDENLFEPFLHLENLEYLNLYAAKNLSMSHFSYLISLKNLRKLDICFTDVYPPAGFKIPSSLTLLAHFLYGTLVADKEAMIADLVKGISGIRLIKTCEG